MHLTTEDIEYFRRQVMTYDDEHTRILNAVCDAAKKHVDGQVPGHKRKICPVCEKGTLTGKTEYSEDLDCIVESSICDECGGDVVTPEQAMRNDYRRQTRVQQGYNSGY